MFQAILLGIVQGITEFLPISSTAHLVLLPVFFQWQGGLVDSLPFDVALHVGTLASILVCFYSDIIEILKKKRGMILTLGVGTIPAGIAGVMLHDYVDGVLRSPYVIAGTLVAFGIVMYFSDRWGARKGKAEGVGIAQAILIGIAQAVALVPGVSRSGITISAALLVGLKREEAARFSFLLSIPVIGGAALLEGRKLIMHPPAGGIDYQMFGVGLAASFVTGVIAIKFLLGYLKKHNLNVFVLYRFVLAGAILGWLWLAG